LGRDGPRADPKAPPVSSTFFPLGDQLKDLAFSAAERMGRAVVQLAGEASPLVDPEPQEPAGQGSTRVFRPLALSDLPRESG